MVVSLQAAYRGGVRGRMADQRTGIHHLSNRSLGCRPREAQRYDQAATVRETLSPQLAS